MLPNKYNCIQRMLLLSLSVLFFACAKDRTSDDQPQAVSFRVAARAAANDISFTTIRYIVILDNGVILNDKVSGPVTSYPLMVKTGDYRLLVIANETADMTAALDAALDYDAFKAVTIHSGLREETVPLMADHSMKVTLSGSTGMVSLDGAAATNTPEVSLERVQAKTALYVRKYTVKGSAAADTFTIKRVTLCHLPKFSHLMAADYAGTEYENHVLYDNAAGIRFDADVSDTQYNAAAEADGGYTSVVAEIPAADQPANIFPEYSATPPLAAAQAAYLLIGAVYTQNGASLDVTYKVPLRADLSKEDYNLCRNINHQVYLTVLRAGEYDAFEVEYTVADWEGKKIDVTVDKDPFLDVTNVEVNAYDAAATRVYFYTNQPVDKVFIAPMGHLGSTTGSSFEVRNLYHKLVAVTAADGSVTERADNFHYEFNATTGVGKGYFDIVNLDTQTAGTTVRVLNLRVGGLDRSITVNSVISEQAAKNDATPYIGTFHRADQRSERLVTWHAAGEWTATILAQGVEYDHLRIDHLASPAYGKGLYKLADPMEAEGAEVSDGTTLNASGLRTLSGRGRVYFRVGWDSFAANANRYAVIEVTYNNGADKTMIYCRQGQDPDELFAGSYIKMSAYNVALPEQFTEYPTMAGYLYQWNDRTPWSTVGTVANYNTTTPHDTFDDSRSVCPDKYGYPDQTAVATLGTVLGLMNSVWGYYADGYFDRRAVSDYVVKSSSVNAAYPGGLFYNPTNGKSVFTPTVGGRLENGQYVRSNDGVNVLKSGFWADYSGGADNSLATLIVQYSHQDKSTIEQRNKLWAMSVRCVKLDGSTVYFDANGGEGAPRSITKPAGTAITLPDAPTTALSNWDMAVCWNTDANGTGTDLIFGGNYVIPSEDTKLYARWQTMENLRLAAGSTAADFIAEADIADESKGYNSHVDGTYFASSALAIAGEPAYPYLEVKVLSNAAGADDYTNDWSSAKQKCDAFSASAGQTWRLPRVSELSWLCKSNPSALIIGAGYASMAIWTGTEQSSDKVYTINPTNTSSMNPGFINSQAKTRGLMNYIVAVREVRPLK